MGMTFVQLQNEVKRRATRNQSNTEFNEATKNLINTSLFRISRECPWKPLRRSGTFETVAPYSTGTGAVSVTNDSKNVTVTGATFITDGIAVGRRVALGGSSKNFTIETITGETTFTVNVAYDGTTSTTQSYKILGQEEYNLPLQSGQVGFVWHEDFNEPFRLEYTSYINFRDLALSATTEGTPTVYRLWGEDQVITQPREASVVTIASTASADTSIDVTVFGTVSGYPDFEIITTNASDGTTSVSGTKVFSSIERIDKAASSTGRINVTTNTGDVTVGVLPVGEMTTGPKYKKIQLWPLPTRVFPVTVEYYKQPWSLVNDGDVHELGQEFDEAIILLAVSKIQAETAQREAAGTFNLYLDELKVLRRRNADILDWFPHAKRPRNSIGNRRRFGGMITPHLGFIQLGGNFGPASLR